MKYLSKTEAAQALGVTTSRINGALRARPDLVVHVAGREAVMEDDMGELARVVRSRRPGRRPKAWRSHSMPLAREGEVSGVIYYNKEHANSPGMLFTPPTPRASVVWVLEALAAACECGCCHPAFRGDDGTKIDVCPAHGRADCPECEAERAAEAAQPPCPHLRGSYCSAPQGAEGCEGISAGSCGCPHERSSIEEIA